jgi:hypothetical protein
MMLYIVASIPVAAAFEEHDACASGWRYDTSPPNGILPVNGKINPVSERQHSSNQ